MPRISSDVPIWNFFEKCSDGSKIATCNYCRRGLSYKTTITNLKSHLKQKHISAYNNFLNFGKNLEETSSQESVNTSPAPASTVNEDEVFNGINIESGSQGQASQPNPLKRGNMETTQTKQSNNNNIVLEPPNKMQKVMTAYLPKKIKPENKKNIDLSLLKMIVYDFQPFSIVEDIGFRAYSHSLNPNYEIPDRKTLSANLLPKIYQSRLEQLKTYVATNAKSVCITVDGWTSRSMESYLAITAHFIVEDNLKTLLIQCDEFEGHHTGERLSLAIKNTLTSWKIYNKVNFFVTDNASNMESAARYLAADGWTHFGCLAHKLNLVVQNALEIIEIKDTIAKVQKTVTHFRKSAIARENLLKYQMNQQNITQPKTVIKSVPTRWNSTYLMLERFLEIKEALRATIPNLDVDLPVIPMEEWKCIEQICVVLKPFYEATKEMSAQNYLVASKAIVLTSSLINICHNYTQLSDLYIPVKSLAQKLKDGMIKRLGDLESIKEIAMCTLLDPRFKLKPIKKEENKTLIKNSVLNKIIQQLEKNAEIRRVGEPNQNPMPSTSTVQQTNYYESDIPSFDLWSEFDKEANKDFTAKTTCEMASEELEKYLAEPIIKRVDCPFKWWRDHKCLYPELFKLFLKYSNIMVTSVPCEQMFSKSGYIISDRRTRLSTRKVNQIMFLNVNKF